MVAGSHSTSVASSVSLTRSIHTRPTPITLFARPWSTLANCSASGACPTIPTATWTRYRPNQEIASFTDPALTAPNLVGTRNACGIVAFRQNDSYLTSKCGRFGMSPAAPAAPAPRARAMRRATGTVTLPRGPKGERRPADVMARTQPLWRAGGRAAKHGPPHLANGSGPRSQEMPLGIARTSAGAKSSGLADASSACPDLTHSRHSEGAALSWPAINPRSD